MVTLTELRDMLAKAEGPSREIDLAIERFTTGWPLRWCEQGVTYDRFGPGAIGNPVFTAPVEFTSSIDAALTLVERLLPGWRVSVSNIGDRGHSRLWEAELVDPDAGYGGIYQGHAPTATIAILTALVEALIAKEKTR